MPVSLKTSRPSCRRTLKVTGTAATNGHRVRRFDTTCGISKRSNAVVDAARVWIPKPGGGFFDKGEFIERAIDELAARLLRENADFNLPPGLVLEITAS